MFDIAIVGVGATCISLLKEIQEQVFAFGLREPRIVLFSPRENFARGKAFGDSDRIHKVNTPPYMLSVSTCEPTSFSQWLNKIGKEGELYPNRLVYSNFLKDTYKKIISSLLLDIEEIYDEVYTITRQSSFYRLHTKQRTVDAHKVVLCLGSLHGNNFTEINKCDGFIDHFSKLYGINDAMVLIAGTGLTSVDMFRSLNRDRNCEIHLFSRNGFVPTCATMNNTYVPSIVNWKNFIMLKAKENSVRLHSIIDLFKREIRCLPDGGERKQALQILQEEGIGKYFEYMISKAKSSDCPFQDVLVSTRPYIHNIWCAMPIEDRISFDNSYASEWSAWRHPISHDAFSEMGLAAKEKRLHIHKSVCGPRIENGQFVITTTTGKVIASKKLVDGTGGNMHLGKIGSILLDNLINQNLIEAHPCGGINISPVSFQCQFKGRLVPNLYNIGPLNRGSLFSTNAFWFNARCASHWARQWATEISRQELNRSASIC